MTKTVLIDANVIIRFLLNDHPKLSGLAKSIFSQAQEESIKIYLDEVVLAEVVWTLSSFYFAEGKSSSAYKIKKTDLVDKLQKLISQNWIINPKKNLMLETLNLYLSSGLDYIDCWVFVKNKNLGTSLETFDKKLKKLG